MILLYLASDEIFEGIDDDELEFPHPANRNKTAKANTDNTNNFFIFSSFELLVLKILKILLSFWWRWWTL